MSVCDSHKTYLTRAEADEALLRIVEDFKQNGRGGKSHKRLCVFACGDHWHIGRANKYRNVASLPATDELTEHNSYRGFRIVTTERPHFWDFDFRKGSTPDGWISVPKLPTMTIELACQRVMDTIDQFIGTPEFS